MPAIISTRRGISGRCARASRRGRLIRFRWSGITATASGWIFGIGRRGHQRRGIIGELSRIDYALKPLDIVLLWTGSDQYLDNVDDYVGRAAGLSLAGQNYLLDQGVKLIGIDAMAMDVSLGTMVRGLREGKQDALFPAHFVGREREHIHMEKLANLGAIPRAHGFKVSALPIKITGGSAGWVRPVAIVED